MSSSDQQGPPGTISAHTSSETAALDSKILQLGLGSGLIHLKSSTWSHLSWLSGWFLYRACKKTPKRLKVRKGGFLRGVKGETYVCLWNPAKSDSGAVLDDRMTPAVQVDVDILALVNPRLSRRHYKDTVGQAGDVNGSVDASCDDQASADVLEGQSWEWRAAGDGSHRIASV